MSELIDWAERAGLENLKFRLQNSEALAKEASSTLTVLLAGVGGSLAYAVKGFERDVVSPLVVGAAAMSGWLMLAGCLLIVFCMLTTSLPAPTNEPKNLYQKTFAIELLREVELENIQERIEQTAARNHRVAAWLDRCRLLVITSPLIFVVAAFFAAAH
ncbi:MAG: hypothetical protein Q8M07_02600 [Prosthecobacter sp.]|nr:hypothetical protein [Prosthecobacter sp.]